MTLLNAIRAEVGKLLTVRLWWILLIILVGYVAFTAGLLAVLFGAIGEELSATPGAPQLPPDDLPPIVYSVATSVGYVIPLLLGTLATTNEFKNQTLTPTFLATPRRGVVLAAKLLVLTAAGALFGVAALIGSVGVGAPLLAATGNDAALEDGTTWTLAARVVIAMALWAAIGVGLGVLVPNQVASIVIVLGFTQFLEPVLRFGASIWDWAAEVGKFLPGAASDALVGASIFNSLGAGTTEVRVLEWWQGGLVLVVIAIVASGVGWATTWRRDVT